ncbi:hypothetical protein FN846DRAFT_889980 [Sphaerosporella brunnea]|uniref:Uncharacterized protein n=1 Tax=Sphaerosporella brunnea TaxID=1250544 RepID=A0A5J5EYU2_9PEZI|nr:hypothetical protein FN846DRAFT_889980 [Sphaerosporella brunnea]
MAKTQCNVCSHVGPYKNHARHMRRAHHMYLCAVHLTYEMAVKYQTENTALLRSPWPDKASLPINPPGERPQAEGVEHGNNFADSPAEGDLAGNEAEVVEYDDDFANFTAELAGDDAEVVENDFAHPPAEDELVDKEAEVVAHGSPFNLTRSVAQLNLVDKEAEDKRFMFRPRGYGSLPAMGAYGSNPKELAPRLIIRDVPVPADPDEINRLVRQQRDEAQRQRPPQAQDDALQPDQMRAFHKELSER